MLCKSDKPSIIIIIIKDYLSPFFSGINLLFLLRDISPEKKWAGAGGGRRGEKQQRGMGGRGRRGGSSSRGGMGKRGREGGGVAEGAEVVGETLGGGGGGAAEAERARKWGARLEASSQTNRSG